MNVRILLDKIYVKITFESIDELPEILEFEGRRIASLLSRGLQMPEDESRVWDSERKITRSSRE